MSIKQNKIKKTWYFLAFKELLIFNEVTKNISLTAASPPRRVCMKLSETPNSKDEPKILQSQDSLEDENENSENDIENENNNDDVDAEQNITGVSFSTSITLCKHLNNFNNFLDWTRSDTSQLWQQLWFLLRSLEDWRKWKSSNQFSGMLGTC